MAAISKNGIQAKYIENAQTTQYTASNVRARLDNITVTNVTGAAATFSINIVPSAGSAATSNLIISTKSVQPGEVYRCPELVNKVLNSGSFLSAIAGTASALVIDAAITEMS